MKRVVRDVVNRAHDPAAVVAEVEHIDARGRLFERAEVGPAAGGRGGDEDAVDAAVEDRERRLPRLADEPVERRKHAVERLAERLAAEEALVLLRDRQRSDEDLLELVRRHGVEAAPAPFRELREALRLDPGSNDRSSLDSPRQR